jgi:hypothetical protein
MLHRNTTAAVASAALALNLLGGTVAARAEPSRIQVADIAGEWTRCVAWSGGETWNIVNGGGSQAACFALGRRCTGNPNATITYYSSAVVVNAPYRRCTAW